MQKQLTTNKIKTASYVAVGGCGQEQIQQLYNTTNLAISQVIIDLLN